MKSAGILAGVVAFFLAFAMIFTAGWDAPPVEATQTGYRGSGMAQIERASVIDYLREVNENVPEAPYPYEEDTEGPTAGEVYENVQVLANVPASEFNRMMLAITEWVVPEDVRNDPEMAGGCNYCHNPTNLASDELYTKVVARRMIQMTQHINANWSDHVAETGVTCYTCHRGNAVPANVSFAGLGESTYSNGGGRPYQNTPTASNAYTSLPTDPFGPYLQANASNIRLQNMDGWAAEPANFEATEATYALMMHISDALGVNCTFCHNTRAFSPWEQSTAARTTAWHGIQMAGGLNDEYLYPLESLWPENRLGPDGQAPGLSCATCHNGLNRPLNGAAMSADWPYLRPASYSDFTTTAQVPATEEAASEPESGATDAESDAESDADADDAAGEDEE